MEYSLQKLQCLDNTQVEEIPRVNSEDGVFENEETLGKLAK